MTLKEENNNEIAGQPLKNKNVKLWQEGAAVKITTGELAGTIAKQGIIATIGGAGMTPEELRREMHIAREISPDGEIGVNLMYVAKDFHRAAQTVQECGGNFIVLAAGYDSKVLNRTGEYEDMHIEMIPKVAHPSLALRVLQSGVVKRIVLEGSGCGGHIGFSSIKSFISTHDLVKMTRTRFNKYLADHVLGKNAPESEIAAFITDMTNNPEEYRKKYHIPKLAAAGGINEDNMQAIIDAGADFLCHCLIYTISKESNAHDNWKKLQFEAKSRTFFESPVKGMIGSAIKNAFIEKYFELDDTGVYRFKATAKYRLETGKEYKSEFFDRCNTECMSNNFCLKYVKEYKHPMCIFHRLEETACSGNVDDGIVFTSENINYIQKVAFPNIPAKDVVDMNKKLLYGRII
ncbi:MAG TPA: nitronate monooxygenase [Candidatus Wallbacteria bacterium]|nr:nitronate monooxygenase [Candidatus Wallbacteria bacterium]